jgi:pimeloyl-ACP methyl ester carboxylesterase
VQPELRYARSGELFIAYTIEGDGPLTLIVTTGHFFHLEVARAFARLILIDRRGTGLSDGMHPGTSVDDAMDDIRAVMDDAW